MDGTTLCHKAGEATDGGKPLVARSDLAAPRGLEVGEKSADEIRREIDHSETIDRLFGILATNGHTREEVAELYNLALSAVGGFIRRKRETGSVSLAEFGGHKTFALAPHTDLVKRLVAEQPDSTLA